MVIQIIITSFCILLSLYGLYEKNGVYIKMGYFVYGIVVVISEFNFFYLDPNPEHFAVATLYGIQSLLALPNKSDYDGSKFTKSTTIKIYTSLSLINFFGIYIVGVTVVPNFVRYFHLVLAIFPLVFIFLVLRKKTDPSKQS